MSENEKYSTIQQHQPLRIPASFDKQGRALILQLDEILDDIYRRFGRLRVEDLGTKLKDLILVKDEDGKYTSISTVAGELKVEIGDIDGVMTALGMTIEGIEMLGKYIKINTQSGTALLLDENGIDMQTPGKAHIHAANGSASSIIFGSDIENANFAVGDNGELTAKAISTPDLTVNGNKMPQIVVSEIQPDGSGIVWLKPSSTSSKEWTYPPADNEKYLNTEGGTLACYRDYTIPYAAADYIAGDLLYGITVKLYVFSLSSATNITFKARLANGLSWIDIGSVTQMVYSAGTTITLNVMMDTVAANVMDSVSGGNFTVRLETDYDKNKCQIASSIALKAKNTSASGVSACSVFYIN